MLLAGTRPAVAPLPWQRPRFELLLVALVAVVALSPVYITNAQDGSRLCLTRALLHGRLTIDPCVGKAIDQAHYHGKVYSDKAPGLSLLAIPPAVLTRLPSSNRWVFEGDLHLWAVRVLTSGLAFLFLVFSIGRISEGLAPGCGGLALVTFGLGTLEAPLAATTLDHVTAGALSFGAFLLACRRRPGTAGLAAGLAVLVEYQTALVGIVLAVYVALQGGRALLRYALGSVPGLAGLAAYDWATFGSPLHLSYRYIANRYASDQASGFFGIGLPRAHAVREVFLGDRGLLVASPVLVAAAAGLFLLARRQRDEAVVCGAVTALFLLVNFGYFLPYGGTSPGPRFFATALPFLALGLGPAFARWRVPTLVLAAVSIVATTAVMLTWAQTTPGFPYRQTIWGEIARLPVQRGHELLVSELAKNVLVWAGPNRLYVAAILAACATVAFVVAAASARHRTPAARTARS